MSERLRARGMGEILVDAPDRRATRVFRRTPLIAAIVGMIAVSMGVWVIAIGVRVGMRVWVIAVGAVGPVHMRRGNAIAAQRDAASVGSTSPSGTASIGDWRYAGRPIIERREGHRVRWDHHETEQRKC